MTMRRITANDDLLRHWQETTSDIDETIIIDSLLSVPHPQPNYYYYAIQFSPPTIWLDLLLQQSIAITHRRSDDRRMDLSSSDNR